MSLCSVVTSNMSYSVCGLKLSAKTNAFHLPSITYGARSISRPWCDQEPIVNVQVCSSKGKRLRSMGQGMTDVTGNDTQTLPSE